MGRVRSAPGAIGAGAHRARHRATALSGDAMFTASSLHLPRGWRSPRHWAMALALCASIVGPHAQAQPSLSLDEALRLAQERSRQLPAQDAATAAAREMAVAAGQWPDPTLTAGINN